MNQDHLVALSVNPGDQDRTIVVLIRGLANLVESERGSRSAKMKLKTYGDKTRSIGKLETLVRMGNIVTRTLSDEYKCEGDFLLRPKSIEV